jgi:predicted transcriptional regulator
MFNTFFKGTTDDFLNHVLNAPKSEIDKVGGENEVLNREECISLLMDDFKMPKEKAEKIVTEIQLEEFHEIAQRLVNKGFLEVTEYDEEFQPVYKVTEAGRKFAGLT